MFKIGEFSSLTRVSVRMLRYYDENGLLKPAVTDPWTGYRMYSAEQIPLLCRILFLRDTGFSVAQIAAILPDWDERVLRECLEQKRNETDQTMKELKKRLDQIDQAVKDIGKQKLDLHSAVTLKSIPFYHVLSLRRRLPTYWEESVLWKEMQLFCGQRGIEACPETPGFAIYHDPDYRDRDVDVEICMEVRPEVRAAGEFRIRETEPVERMACTMVRGPFENIGTSYLAFAGWLEENDRYRMLGTSRQIVHRGPWNEEDPQLWLTEIQISLE